MILQLELSKAQLAEIAKEVAVMIRAGKADTYTVQEAAQMLGKSVRTITRRIEAETIPKVPNLGRGVRIPAAFIDRLVNPNPDT